MVFMNDQTILNQLREASWRRKLTPAEESQLKGWLADHPGSQADWELEAGLNDALDRLANAPVASNFTARTVAAAQLERGAVARSKGSGWGRRWPVRRRLPKFAAASLVLVARGIVWHNHQARERLKVAQSVAVVADLSSLPSPEALQDFDVVQNLNRTADTELLALLQ